MRQHHLLRPVIIAMVLLAPFRAMADASYEACALIASQYLTSVQLMEQGLEPAILKGTLPGLSKAGAKRIDKLHKTLSSNGPVDTYSNIHARFARCARNVHDQRGPPEPGSRQDLFYRCSGENKIRYEIALAAFAGGGLKAVREQLAPRHKPLAPPSRPACANQALNPAHIMVDSQPRLP